MKTCGSRWELDSNRSHHSAIDVLHYMAVKWKRAYNSGIAKIHSQYENRILGKTIPCRHVDGVAQSGFFPTRKSPTHYYEV